MGAINGCRRSGAVMLAIAILGCAGTPGAVNAECGLTDRWPPFVSGARSASSIVVGTVTQILDGNREFPSLRFRFHVTEIVRGRSRPSVIVSANTHGGCIVSVLTVRVGDRLAIAYADPRLPDGIPGPITAVAFVGRRPPQALMPGMQRVGLAEIRALGEGSGERRFPMWMVTDSFDAVREWMATVSGFVLRAIATMWERLVSALT